MWARLMMTRHNSYLNNQWVMSYDIFAIDPDSIPTNTTSKDLVHAAGLRNRISHPRTTTL